MKRLFMLLMSVLAMTAASLSAKAQEITIYLMPGWNWISYTNAVSMDIDEALGDFVPMEGDIVKSKYAQATCRSGSWRGTLHQFTPGLGYHYYSNRGEPVSFVFANPNLQPQVTVTTSEPLLITAVSAMGGGEVTTNDGTYIITKGLCWATHENPTTNDDFYQEAESGVGAFSISMTGLNVGTAYYVRAYAVTPNGTVYGDQKTFTTLDGIPAVSTASVTSIMGATAICGGTVTDNGGLNVTARGVCWSISQNPTVNDSHTTNGSGLGDFTSSITGLSVSTTYYVRAYASTSQGTAYGEEVSFTTRDGIPTLTTDTIWNITGNSARSGGNITDNGGLNVTARGVCWNITPNPTVSDSHTTNGTGMGGFNSIITGLDFSTTYYVRAYATTNAGTGYGNQLSFTTENDLAFIDLGLPSGTLWATYNVGADNPEDYGNYFAWGETQPKDVYNWSTYQYCNGSSSTLTKYCYNSNYGNNGFTDCLVILLPEDDAATAYWGEDWRLPTKVEWKEIYQNTTVRWTSQNGVYGRLFTASNGNSLFLPAAGYRNNSGLSENGVAGDYLSSSLYTSIPNRAWEFNFGENNYGVSSYGHRKLGLSVRAVRSSKPNNDYVDLGLPSGLLWATCNVGAYAPWNSGDYFAWGETQPKSTYDWSTYQYCNDSDHTLTKYCNNSEYGYNGFTDNLTVLLPEDDAATANLGGNWRMPTKAEWEELYQNTTVSGEWEHGEYGLCFTAGNGNSIFLPAVSCIPWEGMSDTGEFGYYWSSSLTTDPSSAWNFRFYSGDYHVSYSMESRYRNYGLPVRPVRSSGQN